MMGADLLRRRMKNVSRVICGARWRAMWIAFVAVGATLPLRAQEVSLQAVVTPSTVILKNGETVTFAIHGFIEFKSLGEVFPYIEAQTQRWNGKINEEEKRQLARQLLQEGIESRVVSMLDERPLQALVTHTSEELRQAIAKVKEPLPPGYAEIFLAVREKWKRSLNCWSASPVIAGRVLSKICSAHHSMTPKKSRSTAVMPTYTAARPMTKRMSTTRCETKA